MLGLKAKILHFGSIPLPCQSLKGYHRSNKFSCSDSRGPWQKYFVLEAWDLVRRVFYSSFIIKLCENHQRRDGNIFGLEKLNCYCVGT